MTPQAPQLQIQPGPVPKSWQVQPANVDGTPHVILILSGPGGVEFTFFGREAAKALADALRNAASGLVVPSPMMPDGNGQQP